MRLAEVCPDTENRNCMKFDCECGFGYQMTASVRREVSGVE
jgi:hypothetical protein